MFGVLFNEGLLVISNTLTSGIVFDDIKPLKSGKRFLYQERFELVTLNYC
ncbi:hypothetical protein HAPAU_33600 [Halalkalicoccus paucihalophilus]|uniref:Uncharacterized protein n=1 Tax=Halalkalicoccus paucihalophilus TaxID=1008153 RepID=A0A151AAI5_9EURY|nr:hypothetical protein HAPAU_33600 [Halalkalicoccus paucihalophilus]